MMLASEVKTNGAARWRSDAASNSSPTTNM
jgi:hypothetical protein